MNIRSKGAGFVQLVFVDINGVQRAMEIPVERYEEAINEGISLDGSSIPGFQGIEDSDLVFRADPDTYVEIPWEGVARVHGYIYRNGRPYGADPRGVLRKTLEKLAGIGITANVGPEVEFYLLSSGRPLDTGNYFDVLRDGGREIRREIARRMSALGLIPEVLHHEVGPGQSEIDFRFSDALRTADNVLAFKYIVKTTAEATFMPKPFNGLPGNGMHLHISLWKDGENAFIGENGLSETALHFIAGILEHAKALTALTNPTVNSYKRLVPGYEAPVYISWGYRNRSALIRVPAFWGDGARIEYRCPDPSANPYLAFAAILSAGLDGIKRKLEPSYYVETNVYEMSGAETLPGSLGEALEELKRDKVVREALGEAYKNFITYKEREWSEYVNYLGAKNFPLETKEVTEWELERYFHT